jgi:hypothetical protein
VQAREALPGLVAAPIGGALGTAAGLARAGGGAMAGKARVMRGGLGELVDNALSIFGLKEVLREPWEEADALPTGLKLPATLANDIADARAQVPKDAFKNGMHAWHAATNAVLANRLGPAAVAPLWVGGATHESPLDVPSFAAEQQFQGTVNHTLDSSTDIIANTFGIIAGLTLPRSTAIKVAAKLGNLIPGPGDPDPAFGGDRPYGGDPTNAWGQYPGREPGGEPEKKE